jgi:phage terminase large subunit
MKIKETDFTITFPNQSQIVFTGLDDETKLLSLAGITVIFIEEVFEVPQAMFD